MWTLEMYVKMTKEALEAHKKARELALESIQFEIKRLKAETSHHQLELEIQKAEIRLVELAIEGKLLKPVDKSVRLQESD